MDGVDRRWRFLTEEDITRTVAAASNMEFVDLSQILVKPEVIDLLPRDKAYRYKSIPIALNDDVLVVAVSDPLNFDTLDNLRFLLKREIEMVCATPGADQTGARQILRQR